MTRWLLLVLLVFVVFVVLVGVFVGWRWHQAHLPAPHVPSVWVNVDRAQTNDAAMFRWVITGRQINGIYVDDDLTNPGCLIEPFVGKIDGKTVSLTATFLDGSGTVAWTGSVSGNQLELDGEVYTPGSATSFARTLTKMKYPVCGPGSS